MNKALTYKANEIIYLAFEKAESIYLIHEGFVKFSVLANNSERILEKIGPGYLFGETMLISGVRLLSAIALTDCRIQKFSEEEFSKFLSKHPAALVNLLKHTSLRLFTYKNRIRMYKDSDPVPQMSFIIRTLLDINKRLGIATLTDNEEEYLDIAIPELSQWCGISETKCEMVLGTLQKKGVIKYDKTLLTVINKIKFDFCWQRDKPPI